MNETNTHPSQRQADAEELSGAEYVADDDRNAAEGYCAVPHQPRRASPRARAEQVRREARGRGEDDAA